jgi:hypothetical protein
VQSYPLVQARTIIPPQTVFYAFVLPLVLPSPPFHYINRSDMLPSMLLSLVCTSVILQDPDVVRFFYAIFHFRAYIRCCDTSILETTKKYPNMESLNMGRHKAISIFGYESILGSRRGKTSEDKGTPKLRTRAFCSYIWRCCNFRVTSTSFPLSCAEQLPAPPRGLRYGIPESDFYRFLFPGVPLVLYSASMAFGR